jgi:hypothetical protein
LESGQSILLSNDGLGLLSHAVCVLLLQHGYESHHVSGDSGWHWRLTTTRTLFIGHVDG